MNKLRWSLAVSVCLLMAATVLPSVAQNAEVKEKSPIYIYVGQWDIPRAQWGEMEKADVADQPMLQQAMAAGTLIAYGSDTNLIHQPDQPTHDDWWTATSMAGVLNMLDKFQKAGTSGSPVLASATKHWDSIDVSRYYNWKPGTYKDAYSFGAYYKLKADAPSDAVDVISKSFIVPLMEQLMSSGAIVEYDIDTQALHSDAPGAFWLFYTSPTAEGIDKARQALMQSLKASPLNGPGFASMVDMQAHRDYLTRTNATFK
jgi:hypothetical protein